MPYSSLAELPDAVKKLAVNKQRIFMAAFNNAYKNGKPEDACFKIAWAAANGAAESVHPDFARVMNKFVSYFGASNGMDKFFEFIGKNKLDAAKPYRPDAQFYESFGWTKPLIQYMRQDKEAKYYLVRALTAQTSMKGKDWSNFEKMTAASKSMNFRPLNYEHNHESWLPYPRTRVDFAKADDFSVECTLRVDNKDSLLQKQLDHDSSVPEKEWINSVSIESRDEPGGGYHFTALAMIRSGYDLPGDPLTEVVPLVFHESMGKSLLEGNDGKLIEETPVNEVKNMNDIELKEELADTKTRLTEAVRMQQEATVKIKSLEEALGKLKDVEVEKERMKADNLAKDVTIGDLRRDVETLNGKIKAYEESMSKSASKLADKEKEIRQLNESIGHTQVDLTQLTGKLNDAYDKVKVSEEKCTQALQDKATIQLQNAQLLEDNNAKRKENLALSESVQKATEAKVEAEKLRDESLIREKAKDLVIQEKDNLVNRAETMLKKAHKLFEQYGIVEIDNSGNVKSPV